MPRTIIIVPAYNESSNIVDVIETLSNQSSKWEIVVINDCSEGNTAELVTATQKTYLINLPVNLGIGGAVQSGFKFAACYNYDLAVQFDGDGQHLASEIPKLLNPIIFIITNRSIKKKRLVILTVGILGGFALYALTLLLLYLTVFSEQEAVNLASFNRYMSTYNKKPSKRKISARRLPGQQGLSTGLNQAALHKKLPWLARVTKVE